MGLDTMSLNTMNYWETSPHAELDGVVESISFSRDLCDDPRPMTLPPDERGAEILVSIELASGICHAEVFGFKTRAISVGGSPARFQMAFNLAPGKLRRLFGIDASELEDDAWPLHELLGTSASLCEELGATRSPQQLSATLTRMLRPRLESGRDSHFVDRAVQQLRRTGGRPSMRQLSSSLGVGLRRLERAFRLNLGCTPKHYAQVIRFAQARRALAAGLPQARVAARLGFSDQAHLVRELRRFGVCSPLGSPSVLGSS